MEVKYIGDSLFEIEGKTSDIDEIAWLIVGSQDGDTIADLIRTYSDHTCEYHGEDIWRIDEEVESDDTETAGLLAGVLMDIDDQSRVVKIIEDYYPIP